MPAIQALSEAAVKGVPQVIRVKHDSDGAASEAGAWVRIRFDLVLGRHPIVRG